MTCNISSPPPFPEAPPLYTARASDPETLSIAPSYTSEAPSYHSQATGLPTTTTYRSLIHTSTQPPTNNHLQSPSNGSREDWRSARSKLGEVDVHAFNIPSWSSVRSSHQEKHYHSVAQRRVRAAAAKSSSTANEGLRLRLPPADCEEPILEEDPYLVGSEAADRARKERLTAKQRGDEILMEEDKAWEFMITQMGDWEARQKSWSKFRREAQKPGLLRRKLGILGTGKW